MPNEMRDEELELVGGGYVLPNGKELRYYCPSCYKRVYEDSYVKDDGLYYFRCSSCGKSDIPANDMKRWFADSRIYKDPDYSPFGRS